MTEFTGHVKGNMEMIMLHLAQSYELLNLKGAFIIPAGNLYWKWYVCIFLFAKWVFLPCARGWQY